MAQSEIILTDVSVEVDDETLTVEGNSVVIKEGLGEASVKAATNGSTPVVVISEDVTTKIGMIKFSMPASIKSMNKAREFKARGSSRVVRVTGTDASGARLGRVMTQAILANDPEKAIQADGVVEVEFMGAPLVTS